MIAHRFSASTPANLNRRHRGVLVRTNEIDLAQPFEQVLAMVLSLPPGCARNGVEPATNEADLKEVIQCLYEAANGRQVETHIGMVAIAPPVASWLRAKPLHAATQIDFLISVATCILCGALSSNARPPVMEHCDEALVSKRTRANRHSQRASARARRVSPSLQVNAVPRHQIAAGGRR